MFSLRNAVYDDIPALAKIASAAFAGNPLFAYIFNGKTMNGDIGIQAVNRMPQSKGISYFSFMLRGGLKDGDVLIYGDPPEGFNIIVPDSEKLYSLRSELSAGAIRLPVTCGLRCISRSLKLERVLAALRREYLPEKHLYIYLICVLPGFQGSGVGTGLLAYAAKKARATGVPLALETMTPDLSAYYKNRGFRVTAVRPFPEAGLELYGMVSP